MNIDTTVGTLAAEHPLSTRVFARHQIDFCCGGGRPLAEVCAQKGLDANAVLDEIRREVQPAGATEVRWDQAPLGSVIDHILNTYHESLREELPRLEAMARKVVRVHGDKDRERLPALLSTFLAMKAELDDHMIKEEQVLFPMIRRGQGSQAQMPMRVMVHEHDSVGVALKQMRALTDGYTAPEGACNTWRALWFGLATLETELQEHIHLENNVLFPRALNGAI